MTGLSVSSYYYKPRPGSAERVRRDADLRDQIEAIQAEFPRYGYRRVRAWLKRLGMVVYGKRIRRVMRECGLFPAIRRAFVATTDSDHGFAVYPNLVKGVEVNAPTFLEKVYNKRRLHSAFGYMPPEKYEQVMMERSITACRSLLNSGDQVSS